MSTGPGEIRAGSPMGGEGSIKTTAQTPGSPTYANGRESEPGTQGSLSRDPKTGLAVAGATDYSNAYGESKNYYLYFTHLPSGRTYFFKSFITSYSDAFTSNWANESVYGRMDEIYTFQNTTRRIDLGFSIPAFDEEEARCNLIKINTLARKLYPYYSGPEGDNALSITRAPLMRIKFANLIQSGRPGNGGLLGKMNGFTFTPRLEDGFFDRPGLLYPKSIDISFTFDVLHEHIMGWTDSDDQDERKIWAGGQGPGFAYGFGKKSLVDQTPNPADTPTDEDAEAELNEALGG